MKKRSWCQICRDELDAKDDPVECILCPKRFHKECLQYEGLVTHGEKIDPETFTCESCVESDDIQENEDRCKICREKDKEEKDLLLLCDGCPNSYHMSCLNLQVEPDGDRWYCPECRPQEHHVHNVHRIGRSVNLEADHVNCTYCYVCQRPGKMLGCDFCPNSFHPNCLPELDFDNLADTWECPCCQGKDPLLNQAHKRWTKIEMASKAADRDKSIALWRVRNFRHRNRFLLAHQEYLRPFVTEKTLRQLQRSFTVENAGKANKKGRLVRPKSMQSDILDQIEDEAKEEAEKFIKKAYRDCRYKSGRQIEGRPLKEGTYLKPHQEDGVEWLLQSFLTGGAILADEMGLGKTIQTLCFLSYLNQMGVSGPHLIVVPLSTVGNWLREIHRFTNHLTVIKVCGSKSERSHAMWDRLSQKGLYDIYVTTYETVKSEESFFSETIPRWQTIVLDEAHRIKTQSGAIRHSIDRVNANMRLLLTGTPLQNNAAELFTLINFIFPDVFKESSLIEQAFMPKSSYSKKSSIRQANLDTVEVEDLYSKEDLEAIRLLLSKVMLRRVKEQSIRLPQKIFKDIWLPLSSRSAHWYKQLLEIRSMQDEGVSFKKLLGLVIKMRIICGHSKGIVSRASQMEKLKDFFREENEAIQKAVMDEATKLQSVNGESHISASAKLSFLDLLLCRLHHENMTYIKDYKEQNIAYRKELETYALHKMQEEQNKFDSITKKKEITKKNKANDMNESKGTEENSNAMQSIERHGWDDLIIDNSVDFTEFMSFAKLDDTEVYKSKRSIQIELQKMAENSTDSIKQVQNSKEENTAESTTAQATQISNSSEHETFDKTMMHKVLVFTQFQLVLDELEAYCQYRGWRYMRLDGSTNKFIRELDIREFNLKTSTHFVYLISTRAGGLGINLSAANHVVMFDEDWNPFIDLQAIDRAHRIGQFRDLHVWKLMTEWTVEERMAFRREQKIKLDKMLIQANDALEPVGDNSAEMFEEKLSVDEIKKLMLHGKTAIKNLACSKSIDIRKMSLSDLIRRQREPLPILTGTDSIELDAAITTDEEDEVIDVAEVMHDEAEEPAVVDSVSQNENASSTLTRPLDGEDRYYSTSEETLHLTSPSGSETMSEGKHMSQKGALEEQLRAAGVLWRSGRERKKPQQLYVPTDWGQNREQRVLKHEPRCFHCQHPKNHKNIIRDKQGKETDVDLGELVPCFRCPRQYHKICEGIPEGIKRTWSCRWHECCICFRKASQCGGYLIHCANCPTSFCFDCFPPDYIRHTVPESYYHNLRQRGYNVSPSNLLLFLCSKCKAVEGQSLRRKMSKAERETQKLLQKNIRDAERLKQQDSSNLSHQDRKKATQERRIKRQEQEAMEQKLVAHKMNVDKRVTELETALRDSYEQLFPPDLVKYIVDRVKTLQLQRQVAGKEDVEKVFGIKNDVIEHVDEQQGKKLSDQNSNLQETKSSKKGSGSLPYIKAPRKTLSICENCRLPCHNAGRYVGECPFPAEIMRKEFFPSQSPMGTSPQTTGLKNASDTGDTKEHQITRLSVDETSEDATGIRVFESPNHDEQIAKVKAFDALNRKSKPTMRSICPLCGVNQKSKLSHSRRHCSLLTNEQSNAYENLYSLMESLVVLLQRHSAKPSNITYSSFSHSKIKSLVSRYQEEADQILEQCMVQCGLGHVVSSKKDDFRRRKPINSLEPYSDSYCDNETTKDGSSLLQSIIVQGLSSQIPDLSSSLLSQPIPSSIGSVEMTPPSNSSYDFHSLFIRESTPTVKLTAENVLGVSVQESKKAVQYLSSNLCNLIPDYDASTQKKTKNRLPKKNSSQTPSNSSSDGSNKRKASSKKTNTKRYYPDELASISAHAPQKSQKLNPATLRVSKDIKEIPKYPSVMEHLQDPDSTHAESLKNDFVPHGLLSEFNKADVSREFQYLAADPKSALAAPLNLSTTHAPLTNNGSSNLLPQRNTEASKNDHSHSSQMDIRQFFHNRLNSQSDTLPVSRKPLTK